MTTIRIHPQSSFVVIVSTVTLLARHPGVQAEIICFRITLPISRYRPVSKHFTSQSTWTV